MTDEELRDKWLAYELYLFIIPYAFMYGNDFIKENDTPMDDKEFFEEVLKQFKERKEK